MRKVFFVMLFLFSFSSVSADRKDFYRNGKLLDTMYVKATSGLRIRDFPSLDGEKLCTIPYALPLKILAITDEVMVDGIKSCWVEVLIPKYLGIDSYSGFVFGGYLSKSKPPFIKPSSSKELGKYLSSMPWVEKDKYGQNYVFYFYDDGRFYRGVPETDIGESGTWKAVSRNKVRFHTEYIIHSSEDSDWFLIFSFKNDGSFYYESDRQTYYLSPFFSFDSKSLYELYDGKSIIAYYLDDKDNRDSYISLITKAIEYGVSAEGTDAEDKYHEYWDPIMERFQQRLDEKLK